MGSFGAIFMFSPGKKAAEDRVAATETGVCAQVLHSHPHSALSHPFNRQGQHKEWPGKRKCEKKKVSGQDLDLNLWDSRSNTDLSVCRNKPHSPALNPHFISHRLNKKKKKNKLACIRQKSQLLEIFMHSKSNTEPWPQAYWPHITSSCGDFFPKWSRK